MLRVSLREMKSSRSRYLTPLWHYYYYYHYYTWSPLSRCPVRRSSTDIRGWPAYSERNCYQRLSKADPNTPGPLRTWTQLF